MAAKKASKKPKPKKVTKVFTYSDLARLNTLFKDGTVGDLQVSYATYQALKAVAKQVADALVTIGETQTKYVADGLADELYQEFITAQNQINKDHPDDSKLLLAQHAQDNTHLTGEQSKRTASFQALLDSDSQTKIKPLTKKDYPDLYAAELSAGAWEVISLILE